MSDLTKSNPFAASVRLQHDGLKAASGQRRHDLRIGRQPAYVAADRSAQNRVLIANADPSLLRDLCAQRRQAAGAKTRMRRTAAVASSGIITFGSEAAALFERLDAAAQDAAFRDLAERVADRLGTSLHGLVVHLDESAIHAHFQLAAFSAQGRPLSAVCSPRVLSEIQDLTAEVMSEHCPGIERGRAKRDRLDAGADYADTLHKAVRELHRDLPADLAAKRAEAAEAAAAAEVARERQSKNEELAAKARRDLDEANGDAKKIKKRLATYEKRLVSAAAEVEAAEARALAVRSQIVRMETAAAETARVQAAAYDALARDIEAGATVSAAGRLVPFSPDLQAVVAPAYPAIRPAVRAATEVARVRAEAERDRAAAKAARADAEVAAAAARAAAQGAASARDAALAMQKEAAADRRAAATARAEAETLRERLARVLDRVVGWLRRSDLPPAIRAEARQLALEAGRTDVPRPTLADLALAPQEPRQKARPRRGGDAGPGLS